MQPINFEIDTGPGITLITSEINHLKNLSNYELSHTKKSIKTYPSESLTVLRKLDVTL